MKIVFMGTPQFAIPSLQKLIDNKYDIAAVVTQPDRRKGRGHRLIPPPVKTRAEEHGIPVLQFEKIRKQGIEAMVSIAPDIIITAAYGQILPQEILDIPPLGCINVHASLLPKYRGAAPVQWAIINGEKLTGATIMYMDAGLDTGDIISSTEVPIDKNMTGGELYERLAQIGAELLADTLNDIENGTNSRAPQDESKASYYPPLNKEMGKIDWNKPATQIRNLIRALDPVMSAYACISGDIIKIRSAEIIPGDASPAKIVCANAKEGLVVGTGDDLLRITCLQAPGSKRMRPEEYFRGRSLPGEMFE